MAGDEVEVLDINLDALKVREIEEIEDLLGVSIEDAFADGKPRGKALRALAFVAKKRTEPNFTWEDAGELTINLAPVDPTQAAGGS